MALEIIDAFIDLEDDIPHRSAIHLVLTGEFRDHGVVGTESALHHPLALEEFLLHRLEPGLLAPVLLGPLNVLNVDHPLTRLNGLRVLHHLRKVRVDDLLIELVLG